MVLVECLDLAGVGIEPEHRAGIEIVTGVGSTRPGRGIADAPVNGLGVLVVITGHPGGSAARLPVVAAPRVMTGFALAGDGEGPPQFLAVTGVKRDDVAPHAKFAARATDD